GPSDTADPRPEDGDGPSDAGRLLQRAAERAAGQEFYLAAVLKRYQQQTDQDDAQVAAMLGVPPEALPRLALCRAPVASGPAFRQQVERIAAFAGVRAPALAQIVRTAASFAALSSADQPAKLLAARDRDEEPGASLPPEQGEPQ